MMGLTDFNLTPKAKKGLKDAKKFAEANGHSLVSAPHLIYGCLSNLSDSCILKLKGYGVPLDSQKFVKIFKDYSIKNEKSFESSKGQGGWHQEINEILLLSKEFSDTFDSFFIGVEHILYIAIDSGGEFIDHLRSEGIDPIHIKDVIETHVLETSIPPTDQIKTILQIEGKRGSFSREEEKAPLSYLDQFCINLN